MAVDNVLVRDSAPCAQPEPGLPPAHRAASAFRVPAGPGITAVRIDPASRSGLVAVGDAASADFCAIIVSTRENTAIALIARHGELVINGLPRASPAVLQSRDVLTMQGESFYATEKVAPVRGRPTPDMLGVKCLACRVPISEDTLVWGCAHCQSLFHDETEESHPQLSAEDRLSCASRLSTCPSCGQPLCSTETLAWDPADLRGDCAP